jgi:glycine cleavage system H protein
MSIVENYRYTAEHEWVSVEGDIATVGITYHAQAELTDIVFVELPKVGKVCAAGDSIAVVESTKTASDIYAPLDGEIIEGNLALEGDPSLVNSAPYEGGWIFKIKLSNLSQLEGLMDAAAYAAHIA